jgi:lysophospholipase L1-like esterase
MQTIRRILVATMLLLTILAAGPAASRGESGRDNAGGTSFAPTVAVAPDGSLWAAWVVETGGGWEIVASRSDGRAWEPAQIVDGRPGRWDAAPSLAFDAGGTAWLAWSSSTGTDDSLYLSHGTGGSWSTAQEIPFRDTLPNRQPVLAPAPGGGLWLAWVGFDGTDDEIYAAFWNGVNWSHPERVSDDDRDPAAYDTQPRLAVGPDGAVWLAWTGHEKFLDNEIYAAHWGGGQWLPEQRVSADDDAVDSYPSLAVAGDGSVWLAWQGATGSEPDQRYRIYAARWNVSAGWSTESMISSLPKSDVMEEQPGLALDPQGQVHVVWLVDGGQRGVGHAVYDGRGWSLPWWAVQDPVAGEIGLVARSSSLLVWSPGDPGAGLPFREWALGSDGLPLPFFEAPARSSSVDSIVINRHMPFGDSITWGLYDDPVTGLPVGSYPSRLEEMLDTRIIDSQVVNQGMPGEQTPEGKYRLKDEAWPATHPQFVEIMEGTNDVTHSRPYDDIAFNLALMIGDSKQLGSRPLLGTLIPRLDIMNDETAIMNGYIVSLAVAKKVALADTWKAFYDYGDWPSLFRDSLHPNTVGMAILTNSWYNTIVTGISWLNEETTPPTTWMEPLPAQSPCGLATVQWNGSDNLSWVTDYDVQVQVNYGAWMDWLVATPTTSGIYSSASYGDTVGFRVRGRDVVGNQSDYSATVYTTMTDIEPPYNVQVQALPAAQTAPFQVRWSAADACSQLITFDVQYRIGPAGTWQNWLSSTPLWSGSFDPPSPQYGQAYYFRIRAGDLAGNWSDWSSPVSTILARFTLSGRAFTARHESVAGGDFVVSGALAVDPLPGGYRAFVAGTGNYDLQASRNGFGTLPPMHVLSVTTDLDGLDFVLPPVDDVVSNGGFEGGGWGGWQVGGSVTPALVAGGHTGYGAALLGGTGGTSWLSQALSVPSGLSNPTLSFLARLDGSSGSSAIEVEVQGAGVNQTVSVPAGGWHHIWLPVQGALGKAVTLVLTVTDNAAVRVDEVSLGSAQAGGSLIYSPLIRRNSTP